MLNSPTLLWHAAGAEPNRAELRRLMREVVSNPEAARERGANARADALHRWSPDAVGRIAVLRLAQIMRAHLRPAPTSQ